MRDRYLTVDIETKFGSSRSCCRRSLFTKSWAVVTSHRRVISK